MSMTISVVARKRDLAAEQAEAAVDVAGEDAEEPVDDAGAAHALSVLAVDRRGGAAPRAARRTRSRAVA